MNMKFTTGLLAVLVVALIVVVAMQHRDMSGMQKQLDMLMAQPDASDTLIVATADTKPDTDSSPRTDAATTMPSSTPTLTPTPTPPPASASKPPAPLGPQAGNNQTPPPANDFFNDPYSGGSWDPYREIERMQEEMDRILNEAFGRYGYDPYYGPRGGPGFGPNYGPGPGPGMGPGPGPGPRISPPPGFGHPMRGPISPAMDVQDNGDSYLVLVDLPGTDADSISVKLDGDILSVSAAQSYDKKNTDSHGNVIYRERRSGSFRRSTSLPGPVKQSGMKTDYDNGVLRITIPKA